MPYIKSPKIKADLLFLCGRIKVRQGDYKSATKYLMDAKWLKDSIFKKEAAELLTKSEIRYGLERKENENKQLHAQNRIQQLEDTSIAPFKFSRSFGPSSGLSRSEPTCLLWCANSANRAHQ
jgi:hypothetical protein